MISYDPFAVDVSEGHEKQSDAEYYQDGKAQTQLHGPLPCHGKMQNIRPISHGQTVGNPSQKSG